MRKSTIFGLTAGLALSAGLVFAAQSAAGSLATQADEAESGVSYTLNPAAGAVTDLSTITITFDGKVRIDDTVRPAAVILENTTTGMSYYCYTPFLENASDKSATNSIYSFQFFEIGGDQPAVVSEVGEYVLSIRGAYNDVTLDEDGDEVYSYLPVITANYSISFPVEYTVNPAPGVVNEISSIAISFDGMVGAYDVRPAVGVLENTTTGNYWYCETPDVSRNENGKNVLTFTFAELGSSEAVTITEVGDYQLSIKGLYSSLLNGDDQIDTDLPGITLNYSIAYPVEYTLDPANGASVEDLSKVTLTFPETLVAYYDNVRPAVATLTNTTTGEVWYSGEDLHAEYLLDNESGKEGIQFNITFYELGASEVATVTAPGEYTLSIRGLYTATLDEEGEIDETTDLPVITANYTIAYPVAYTLDPANGSVVDNLSHITLTFPQEIVAYYENVRPAIATLENLTTGEVWYSDAELQGEYVMNEETGYTGIAYSISFYEAGSEEAANITAVGDYVLSIRGLYTATLDEEGEIKDTTDLPVITANYTIVYPVKYTLDPAEGAAVTDLSKITLTFPDNIVAYYENMVPAVATLENTTTGQIWYSESDLQGEYVMNEETGDSGIAYTISFYEFGSDEVASITEVGNYVLSVRGLYTATLDEDGEIKDTTDLPVLTANYSVVYPVSYTISPEDDSVVSGIEAINVTFDTGSNVGFHDVNPAVGILENITTGEVWYCEFPTGPVFDENGYKTWQFAFTELGSDEVVTISANGEYLFTIRGVYTSTIDEDGEESEPTDLPNITAKYTIQYPEVYEFTPAEGSEVEDLSTIVLTFLNNPNVGIEDVRPAPVILENLTTQDSWYCENPLKTRTEDGGSEFTMTFSELGGAETVAIIDEGEYLLTVKGLYTSSIDEDGEETDPINIPDITANFLIVSDTTGIESAISADVYNVYGINGVQVINNGKASDLNSLAPGLYIINGKKVLIRK